MTDLRDRTSIQASSAQAVLKEDEAVTVAISKPCGCNVLAVKGEPTIYGSARVAGSALRAALEQYPEALQSDISYSGLLEISRQLDNWCLVNGLENPHRCESCSPSAAQESVN